MHRTGRVPLQPENRRDVGYFGLSNKNATNRLFIGGPFSGRWNFVVIGRYGAPSIYWVHNTPHDKAISNDTAE
jgi:hypothetical protein